MTGAQIWPEVHLKRRSVKNTNGEWARLIELVIETGKRRVKCPHFPALYHNNLAETHVLE